MSFVLKPVHLPHYTYKDYCAWEGRWELIGGIPYSMTPAPEYTHQAINTKIIIQLGGLLKNCSTCEVIVAPFDWKVSEVIVVQPDAMVVCGKVEGYYLTFPPSIIFEILSPSTAEKDKTIKYEIYQGQGVKYYIIVNPKTKTLEVFELLKGKYTKIREIKNNKIKFDLTSCKINFDFNKIW